MTHRTLWVKDRGTINVRVFACPHMAQVIFLVMLDEVAKSFSAPGPLLDEAARKQGCGFWDGGLRNPVARNPILQPVFDRECGMEQLDIVRAFPIMFAIIALEDVCCILTCVRDGGVASAMKAQKGDWPPRRAVAGELILVVSTTDRRESSDPSIGGWVAGQEIDKASTIALSSGVDPVSVDT